MKKLLLALVVIGLVAAAVPIQAQQWCAFECRDCRTGPYCQAMDQCYCDAMKQWVTDCSVCSDNDYACQSCWTAEGEVPEGEDVPAAPELDLDADSPVFCPADHRLPEAVPAA